MPAQSQPAARRLSSRAAVFILLGSLLVGACAGWMLDRFVTGPGGDRLYETSAQLRLSRRSSKSESPSPDSSLSDEVAETHALLIRSTTVINRAVEMFRLHELTSFQNVQPQNTAFDVAEGLTTRVLRGQGSPGTALLEITYRSTNAVDAVTVVKALIQAYADSLEDATIDVSAESVQQISQTREKLTAELEKQHATLRSHLRQAPSPPPAEDDPNHPLQVRRRSVERRDAWERRRAALQALLTTGEESQRQGKSPAIIGQMLRRDELFREPAAEPDSTGEPIIINRQRTSPTVTIDDERSLAGLFESVRLALTNVVKERQELDEQIRRIDRELAHVRDFETQRQDQEEEIKQNEALRQSLDAKLQEIELAQPRSTLKIEIVAQSEQARLVSRPISYSTIGWGAMLGLLLGLIGLVFFAAFAPAEA